MLISSVNQLSKLIKELEGSKIIAVDTETNGLHAYQSQVCVIQISDGANTWLVDALSLHNPKDIAPLIDIFSDERIRKILHGASHDISSLKHDFGRAFENVFDTYIAAQYLSYAKTGLADLVKIHFGITLEKKLQKKNWAKRPLVQEDLNYLRHDVEFLIPLYEKVIQELKNADLLEEAELECKRLELTQPLGETFDPDGFWRLKGSKELNDCSLNFLKQLYQLRDEVARRWNRPPFKTIPDQFLIQIASAESKSEIEQHPLFSKPFVEHLRSKFFIAFEESRNASRPIRGKIKTLHSQRRTIQKGLRMELEDALKNWRETESKRRNVASVAILPNHLIDAILNHNSSIAKKDDLLKIPFFGKKRVEKYGDTIMSILMGTK